MKQVSNAAYYLDHFVQQRVELDVAPVNNVPVRLDDSYVKQGSLKINDMCAVGDELKVGTVIAPDMTVTLTDAWMFDGIDLNGALVTVRCNATANGTTDTFHLGTFVVDEAPVQNEVISIRAMGEIVKMDKLYRTGDIAFPLTVGQFASALCSLCGFVLHPLGADLRDGVDTTVRDTVLTTEPESGKYTCRQLLGYCAQAMGVNAYMTKETVSGQVVSRVRMRWFSMISPSLGNSRLFSAVFNKDNMEPAAASVRSKNGYASYGSATTNVYNAGYNPLTDGMTQADMDHVARAIYNAVTVSTVHRFTATTMPAPFLEPMDAVQIVGSDNTPHRGFISSVMWEPNKNTVLIGAGYLPSEEDDFSPFTKEQDDIISDMQSQTTQNQSDIQIALSVVNDIDAHVVESGEENGLQYRKWSNGIAECWGVVTTTGAWNAFQSMYMKSGSKSLPDGLFSEVPTILFSAQGCSNVPGYQAFWVGAQTNQHTKTSAKFALFRPTEGSASAVYSVSLHAIGKWGDSASAVVGSAIVGSAVLSE